ncbi:MAG: hypothetical protein U5O16_25410 [Rhodococcus sp. (in: high G+C Gram-positive bacteria)]|uniref:hypothetical protein n=1 Tax=Rhodococcus sp. TaxID=1831 RepID=UPI002ADBD212|nr:hypothetical protein [Rhodococcus sp. (in: high G+C Gram-positive bacteria)]
MDSVSERLFVDRAITRCVGGCGIAYKAGPRSTAMHCRERGTGYILVDAGEEFGSDSG